MAVTRREIFTNISRNFRSNEDQIASMRNDTFVVEYGRYSYYVVLVNVLTPGHEGVSFNASHLMYGEHERNLETMEASGHPQSSFRCEAKVNATPLTMRCSEPGHRVQVAIHAFRGPGR